MALTQVKLAGGILLANTLKAMPNLKVEIWDNHPNAYGWLASTTSNEKGDFEVIINDPVASLIISHTVMLKYRVFRDKTLIAEQDIPDYVPPVNILISDGALDELFEDNTQVSVADDIPTYIKVSGVVADKLGVPLGNLTVNVYESIFRAVVPALVATGVTNAEGKYYLTVHAKNVNNSAVAGKKVLLIEAADSGGTILAQSDNVVIASDNITVDLVTETTNAVNEFDKISTTILTVIGAATISSIDENSDEISYIAKVANVDDAIIKNVVRAHKLADEHAVPADISYSLLKEKGADHDILYYAKEEDDTAIIEKAIANNLIQGYTESELTSFFDSAKAIKADKTKEIAIKGESYALNDIFLSIVPGADAIEKQANIDSFLALYMQEHDTLDDFWEAYTAANSGDETFTEKLQLGLKVSSIANFQPQVTNKIIDELGAADISKIARWDLDTWKTMIGDVCTAEGSLCVPAKIRGEETDPANTDVHEAYAQRLLDISQALYPLSSIAGTLAGSTGGDLVADNAVRGNVVSFIDNNPEFDLRVHSIHEINEDDFDVPAGADVAAIKEALAPVQRIMRVADGNPAAVCAMVADGIHSASAIAAMSYEDFAAAYGEHFAEEIPEDELEPHFGPRTLTSSTAGLSSLASTAAVAYNKAVATTEVSNSVLTGLATTAAVTGTQQAATTSMVKQVTTPAMPPVFKWGFTSSPGDDPVLSQLFGNMDFAACCDCKSLVSPAAYLSDMLQFLRTYAPAVYSSLVAKRPDIINIDLSCKNTDTPIPYIDLVIELLEMQIMKLNTSTLVPGSDFAKFSFQTSRTAEELAAYPEHTYKDTDGQYKDYTEFSSGNAYNAVYGAANLSGALFPSNLPFNLGIEEARTYLSHFGKSRYQLMKLFRPYNQDAVTNTSANPSPAAITDFAIYAEYLGLSLTSAMIVSGCHNACVNPYLFYGSTGVTANFPDPNDVDTIITGNWQDLLSARVDVLLQQAGITYNELVQYLSTRYMATNAVNIMAFDAPDDTCKLDHLKLVFDSPANKTIFYSKFHRFIRLVKAGKLSIYQWDMLLSSMKISSIDNENFQQIGKVLVLADELNIAPEDLACWWNTIDTRNYSDFPNGSNNPLPSLYNKVFNNAGVINNASYNYFANPTIPSTVKYVMTVSGTSVSLLPEIANFCGIGEVELKSLLSYYGIADANLATTTVTLSALSRYYVLARLAKAWKIKIDELVTILRYCDVLYTTPLKTAIPDNVGSATANTMAVYLDRLSYVADMMKAISASRFKVAELNYLFASSSVDNALAPNAARIQTFYEQLRAELNKVDLMPAELTVYNQQLTNVIYQQFAKEFKIPSQWALDILKNSDTTTLVDYIINDSQFMSSTYSLAQANVSYIDSHTSVTVGMTLPVASYASSTNMNNVKPAFPLSKLYDVYRHFAKVTLITTRLKLRTNDFEYLLNYAVATGFEFKKIPVNTTYTVSGATYELPVNAVNGLLRVCRVTDVVNKLALEDGKMGALLDAARGVVYHPYSTVVYAPTKAGVLPGAVVTADADKLTSLQTWCKFFVDNHFDLVNTTDTDTPMLNELVGSQIAGTGFTTNATGIAPLLHVKFSTTASESNFNATNYKSISMALDIIEIMSTCKTIGLRPAALRNLLIENVSLRDTRNLMIAVKGKYDGVAWAKIARPLRDTIRVKQRDALVAYINVRPAILYSNLLIDTQMGTCMMTSRLKQAISTLQLLVDRVVMGVEYTNSSTPVQVTIPNNAAHQWLKWRKWYVIWQANRKVFMFPENWMEPELRDDKTPFFKELEAQLRQDALTTDKAAEAIKAYLYKLDEVARLEPVGTCDENVNGVITTHVIARTRGSRKYYHRTLCNGIWNPWKRIPIDISGDHIVPAVKNGKLHLFWITIKEKQAYFTYADADPDKKPSMTLRDISATLPNRWFYNPADRISDENEGNYKHTELVITLNWSEYKDDVWHNVQVNNETLCLKLSPYIKSDFIELLATGRGTAATRANVYQYLTNNRELSPSSFVISKMYLAAVAESNGDFCVKILFPDTNQAPFRSGPYQVLWNDGTMTYLHGFRFEKSAGYAKVIGNDSGTYNTTNMPAPPNTLLKGMKFVEDVISAASQPLQVNTGLSDSSTIPAYYNYTKNVIEKNSMMRGNSPVSLLANTSTTGQYRLTVKSDPNLGGVIDPLIDKFIYEDDKHTFFVQSVAPSYTVDPFYVVGIDGSTDTAGYLYGSGSNLGVSESGNSYSLVENKVKNIGAPPNKYLFHTFYHPYSQDFIKNVNAYGIQGLYRPDTLNITTVQDRNDAISFLSKYSPGDAVLKDTANVPKGIVDFNYKGAYSAYNWEVFYHMPMLIAQRLSEDQQFAEAQKWYHFIFDPTSPGTSRQRFWKVKPLYDLAANEIETLDDLIAHVQTNEPQARAQVAVSGNHSFEPFALARIRNAAFMSNVLMKYIDNLLAWGDNLFSRDTIESINEATQLYIMAANILGGKPSSIPERVATSQRSYRQLIAEGIDDLGSATAAIETYLGPNISSAKLSYSVIGGSGKDKLTETSFKPEMSYFCLSPNDKLLAYWDKVADRLFKIRHCQNINGTERSLPLFEPPIDPALLVQATAAGVDIESVLNDVVGVNTPNYRFTYMLQKANEFCNDVKVLGGSLLSALEKKDAEALSLLRQGHEMNMLDAVLQTKQIQLDEARANLDALKGSKAAIAARQQYYASRKYMNGSESEYFTSMKVGMALNIAQTAVQTASAVGYILPDIAAGTLSGFIDGGTHIGSQLGAVASAIGTGAAINSTVGAMASMKGGYDRRMDDWMFQARTAELELAQVDKQIIAATIRVSIAQQEYNNHSLQISNAQEIDTFLRSKFTSEELYDWMVGQLSATYFQSYQLALKMAKKAEICYRKELPMSDTQKTTSFIKASYWDSMKKGLLAAESLQYDLRNLETSYIQENSRVLELTKHVSLALLNPEALIALKQTGACNMAIPEELYDMDYPDHYNRRIKSVSISIPCVAGPYTTVPCTLAHGGSYIRKNYTGSAQFDHITNIPCGTIATSSAQNDSGMFEFSFRDERYLPFEGAGAICELALDLGGLNDGDIDLRSFDFNTISDVIIHVKYTAQKGGDTWNRSANVSDKIQAALLGTYPYSSGIVAPSAGGIILPRIFSLKHEFPNQWHAYVAQIASGSPMQLLLEHDHFPAFCRRNDVQITGFHFALRLKAVTEPGYEANVVGASGSTAVNAYHVTTAAVPAEEISGSLPAIAADNSSPLPLHFTFSNTGTSAVFNPDLVVDDIYMIATYQVAAAS